jgi:acyl carrier protein
MSTTPEEIIGRLAAYLGEHLEEKPAAPITGESLLVEDLNLDSIQSFEMVADLEDHYDISIPLDDMQAFRTVGDLARAVSQILASS